MNVVDFAPVYTYRGLHSDGKLASHATYIHDGDSFIVRFVLGCFTLSDQWVRLQHLWCPELHEPGGIEARDYLRGLIDGQPIWVQTFKRPTDDTEQRSFIRLIATVGFAPDSQGNLRDLAATMAASGHGRWTGP